jgi:hypothetical protein
MTTSQKEMAYLRKPHSIGEERILQVELVEVVRVVDEDFIVLLDKARFIIRTESGKGWDENDASQKDLLR